MTSQPTEPNHIQQTLFQLDSPVKTSQSQGDKKALQKLQGLVSSSNSSEPYAWFDQNTSSWKTYQRSLITEWTLYSENFTRQGTMQNGAVYQAALLELAIKETGHGLLPTPRAAIGMGMKLSKGMANLEHKKYLETEIAADLHKSGEVQNTDLTPIGENMYLNPQFVEEMMGYPLNWTQVKEPRD